MSKTNIDLNGKSVLVTGCPGFIGANLVMCLLREMTGGTIISLDNMNDYYDVSLKKYRLSLVEEAAKKSSVQIPLEWYADSDITVSCSASNGKK